jgi:hypothetical protein
MSVTIDPPTSRRNTRSAERAQLWQSRLDRPLLFAAAMVIPIMVLEEAGLPKPWPTVLFVANLLTWLAFLAEVVLMLAVSPDRKQWARTHKLEIAVVLLTPPFLYTAFDPLRSVRLLRLLRLLRLAPLLKKAFSTEGLRYAGLASVATVLSGAIAYHNLQPGVSVWKGIELSIQSILTFFIPTEIKVQSARYAALIIILVGTALVSYLTGAMVHQFLASDPETDVNHSEAEGIPAEAQTQDSLDELIAAMHSLAERIDRIERGKVSGLEQDPGES